MAIPLAFLIAVDAGLIAVLLARPAMLGTPPGKTLALVALLLLPVMILLQGSFHHLEASKSTAFCLSCHVMEPYGRSLTIDSADHLPANHFQNRRIDREQACYTCHTSYAMFGDLEAKLAGVQHLLVNYFGTIPQQLSLYRPYHNRECLHCHAGARAFEEDALHAEEREALAANEISCLECHDLSHDVGRLDELATWTGPPP